jgi:uncharacterized protein YbjT (DUF2867 family)
MISSRGAGDPEARGGPIQPYLVAKHFADEHLKASPLAATILRPTALTNEEGTGRVTAYRDDALHTGPDIPRADVAEAVVACLETDATVGQTIDLFGGATPIKEALQL